MSITTGVSWDDYCAIKAVSITRLKNMARSPKHYRHYLLNPKESRPLSLGRAAHCAVLEPERFATDFASWTRKTASGASAPRKGKHWDAFVVESAGKDIVTEQDYGLAMAMQSAILSNPDAVRYLRTGHPEVVMQWQEFGMPCKGRADWVTQWDGGDAIVGLKTTRDCRPREFGRDAARYGYHLQWAFYADGYKKITGRMPKVVEIVIENNPPHDVVVYVIPDDVLLQGYSEYTDLLQKLSDCEDSGNWPGVAQGEQVLTLPQWVYAEEMEIIGYEQ